MVDLSGQINLELLDLYSRRRKLLERYSEHVDFDKLANDPIFQAGKLKGELVVIEAILARLRELQSVAKKTLR